MKTHKFPASAPLTPRAPAGPAVHKPFCEAGQPAPCPGYFENDVLPCVCGATQDVLSALAQVQVAFPPFEVTAHPVRPKRRRAA